MERGSRKSDALQLMARILNFTDAEKATAGLGPQGGARGWLPSFLGRGGAGAASSGGGAGGAHGKHDGNLRDLWVEFLLNEADRTDATPPGSSPVAGAPPPPPPAAAAPTAALAPATVPAAAPPTPAAAKQNSAG